jgi:membrane dipeptidase
MLVPRWQRGVDDPVTKGLYMKHIIDHWDHICQIAGNANHIGIGSDLDGGFGKEQAPADLETIADLQKYPEWLTERGYEARDIEKVMFRNWINFLDRAWS